MLELLHWEVAERKRRQKCRVSRIKQEWKEDHTELFNCWNLKQFLRAKVNALTQKLAQFCMRAESAREYYVKAGYDVICARCAAHCKSSYIVLANNLSGM